MDNITTARELEDGTVEIDLPGLPVAYRYESYAEARRAHPDSIGEWGDEPGDAIVAALLALR